MQVPCGSVEIWRWTRTSCSSHMPLQRSEAHISSHGVTASHLRHSLVECTWIEIGSSWALPNFLCHPTTCVFSHCLVDSEVAFGSVGMCLLKMQQPPSTSATRHGVVGTPSSYYLVVSLTKDTMSSHVICFCMKSEDETLKTQWTTTFVVFPFHFAFEAMRWNMEVASERLEMSMFVNISLTFNSSILGRLWPCC